MKKCVCTSLLFLIVAGCGGKAKQSGFLTDYSELERISDTSYKHALDKEKLSRYSKFIIDPTEVHLHTDSKAKLKEADLDDLKNYMHKELVDALSDGYEIVYRPGPGVARVRTALTDFKKSTAILNILPAPKLTGAGLGGATMEAEVLDSQSKEQIGALVELQRGNRFSLDGITTWGDAKGVMRSWARSLKRRVDEAHGK